MHSVGYNKYNDNLFKNSGILKTSAEKERVEIVKPAQIRVMEANCQLEIRGHPRYSVILRKICVTVSLRNKGL